MSFVFLLIFSTLQAVQIPGSLSTADGIRTLEVLGLGTSQKFLSQAYPLGGHSGLEVSLGVESLDTGALGLLGDRSAQDSQLIVPSLTIGKGIYNDSEFYFNISPTANDVLRVGLSYRLTFLKLDYLPVSFSFLTTASTSNFKNKLVTRNIGGDLLIGLTLNQFSFFTGAGYIQSSGRFAGGTEGVTANGNTQYLDVESTHFVMGATYQISAYFFGISLDRYEDTAFNVKSGILF